MLELKIRDDGSDVVVKAPLSQAVGYVVVVGIGLVIAFGTFSLRSWYIKKSDCLSGSIPSHDLCNEDLEEDRWGR